MKLLEMLPIKTIDKYLVRGFIYTYVISVLIMISLHIVLDLFANLDEFTETQISTTQLMKNIISYYWYHSFLYFAQVAGMITLVAAAFTLARLQRNNELTAMLAGGISMYRVALPIIIVGMMFNVLWILDQELIIPRIADKLARSHDEAGGKRSFPIWFLKDRDNALLSAFNFDPRTGQMEQMIVMERGQDGHITGTIKADLARWDQSLGRWSLERGTRYSRSFNNADFVISGKMTKEPLLYYESEWMPQDLVLRQATGWTSFMSLKQLSRLMARPQLVPNMQDIAAARHVRLTQPIINILLLLLGLPFFLNREPHNVMLSVGMCLLVTISCFAVSFICHNLSASTDYAALAAWLPIMIFGPVAAVLIEGVKT